MSPEVLLIFLVLWLLFKFKIVNSQTILHPLEEFFMVFKQIHQLCSRTIFLEIMLLQMLEELSHLKLQHSLLVSMIIQTFLKTTKQDQEEFFPFQNILEQSNYKVLLLKGSFLAFYNLCYNRFSNHLIIETKQQIQGEWLLFQNQI